MTGKDLVDFLRCSAVACRRKPPPPGVAFRRRAAAGKGCDGLMGGKSAA